MHVRSDVRLGVIDFLWTAADRDAAAVISHTVEDVLAAEALGIHRYWIGEHHAQGYASGSVQSLISWAAARSSRIRLGPGTALLAYHSPLRLVEELRTLNILSGRADLCVGRGRADRAESHKELLDGRAWDAAGLMRQAEYTAKLDRLRDCLSDDIAVIPAHVSNPEFWICGSATAADAAARLGARFCYTLFHPGKKDPSVMDRYRDGFRPSRDLAAPVSAIGLCGSWADSNADAQAVAALHSHIVYYPSIIGGPHSAAEQWDASVSRYGPDEVVWLDIAPSRAARLSSWTRIMQHIQSSSGRPASLVLKPRTAT
jgi:luciferase family oxidoreductase group 1